MNTVVVGDLHGRLNVAKKVVSEFENHQLVFVGDYVDSWTASRAQQLELVKYILDLCVNRPNTVALAGNHEFSYFSDKYACSGFSKAFKNDLRPLIPQMKKEFRYYTVVNDWLITHAGVSAYWLDVEHATLHEVVETIERSPEAKLLECGWARRGHVPCGGPLWCDYWAEFKPINGIKQIFGHTEYRRGDSKGIINIGDNYNIDCLGSQPEVLHINDEGQVNIIALDL